MLTSSTTSNASRRRHQRRPRGGLHRGEDLSVTDTSAFGEFRTGLAQQHATTIAARAAALGAADNEIATRITAATAELAEHGFTEPGDNIAQAVDYRTAPADPYATLSEARRRALAYADRWHDNAGNPDYDNYGEGGGDCTNFASQVMRAGGFNDVGDGIDDWRRGDADDWYYNNGLHFPATPTPTPGQSLKPTAISSSTPVAAGLSAPHRCPPTSPHRTRWPPRRPV